MKKEKILQAKLKKQMIEEQKEKEMVGDESIDPKEIRKTKIQDQIELAIRIEEYTSLPRRKRFFVEKLGKN